MTAPDPGLTDLIAAHYRHCVSEEIRLDPETGIHTKWIECTCVCGADTSVEVTGDREAAVRIADAEHVTLVVEQHTQGRIAENTGLRRELADEQQRQSDASAELRVLRATITRVRGEVSAYSEIIPAVALADLHAALEGEQQ